MKHFKNLNQLKKGLKEGAKVEIINYLKDTKRITTIKKVQSNSIILMDNDGQVSHLDFQKSKDMTFHDNGNIDFLAFTKVDKFDFKYIYPIEESKLGQTWLTIKIFDL